MAALSLRLPQIPLTNLRFSRTRKPSKILRCFSTSPSVTSEPYTTVEDLSLAPQSIPSVFLESNKWEPFIKKKVVMRVGYVGSDYRGLQMQRDEHELSRNGDIIHCNTTRNSSNIAYELQLPPMAKVHPIFHICLLCPAHGYADFPSLPLLSLSTALEFLVEPEKVLSHHWVKRYEISTLELLIQWRHRLVEEASWEDITYLLVSFDPFA